MLLIGIIIGLLNAVILLVISIILDNKQIKPISKLKKSVTNKHAVILPTKKVTERLDFIKDKEAKGETVWLQDL